MTAVREALIEQVARLICVEQYSHAGGPFRWFVWDRISEDERDEYRRCADAVIALLLPGLGEEVIG